MAFLQRRPYTEARCGLHLGRCHHTYTLNSPERVSLLEGRRAQNTCNTCVLGALGSFRESGALIKTHTYYGRYCMDYQEGAPSFWKQLWQFRLCFMGLRMLRVYMYIHIPLLHIHVRIHIYIYMYIYIYTYMYIPKLITLRGSPELATCRSAQVYVVSEAQL